MPLLHLARYRDIATEVADRLIAGGALEVLVASGGVANAIAAALLRQRPGGFAGLRIETVETFATRVVNARESFRARRLMQSAAWRCAWPFAASTIR